MPDNLYDELDLLYRKVWGKSLHHGLWISGKESTSEAKEQLVDAVLDLLKPQGTVADIGCGYGELALKLAARDSCFVHAWTQSSRQAERIPDHPNIRPACGDWLSHSLPGQSLDQALAVESLSHFASFDRFAEVTSGALKNDGILVVADWFGCGRSSTLLDQLARAGEIPLWRHRNKFIESAGQQGLILVESIDLSHQVARTWLAMLKRALLLPLRDFSSIPGLLKSSWRRPELVWTFPLLHRAYKKGLLEYHLLKFIKSSELSSRPSS